MDQQLIDGYNDFGFRLLQHLSLQEKDKNVLVSPLSVAFVLAMVYNGARGTTQNEISTIIGLTALSATEINTANASLRGNLLNLGVGVTLTTANSLWAQQGIPFSQLFLTTNQRYFGAEIRQLNFSNPRAVDIINDWVNSQTRGKIPVILTDLRPDTRMVLANALYFKGKWSDEFDPKSTTNDTFYLQGGQTKKVPMMLQSGEFDYYENTVAGNRFQAVSLPYGDGRFSLDLFLPERKSSVAVLVGQLTTANWKQWTGSFRNKKGSVSLPRVKMDYETELVSALKAMGVKLLFQEDADLSDIQSGRKLFVDQVRHKTVMEVNEEGTEAAAATAVAVAGAAMPRKVEKPFEFVANRPFVVMLRDNTTGVILFVGTVLNPDT